MYIHTVVDNKCETLLLLAKGKFHGPVAEQTRSKKMPWSSFEEERNSLPWK